jgi:transcriptional regulator with XRE-family HTH domain
MVKCQLNVDILEGKMLDNPRKILDKEFAKRLNMACDSNPHCPPLHQGRLTWLRNELKRQIGSKVSVSIETVRKWFSGDSKPRTDKLRHIAQLLKIDEAWLSLGTIPELELEEKKARAFSVDGAVSVVIGVLQMNGANCAVPETDHTTDLHMIYKGKHRSLIVSLGRQVEGKFKFSVKNDYFMSAVIAVVQLGFSKFDLYILPTEMIRSAGRPKGGYIEVLAEKSGQDFKVGDQTLIKLKSPTQIA